MSEGWGVEMIMYDKREIPKMEFGNLASEEQILDDLNNRECEIYEEDEKIEETEEQMTEGEIKEKQEKNRNEMEEIVS